jgi:hypothetical protein
MSFMMASLLAATLPSPNALGEGSGVRGYLGEESASRLFMDKGKRRYS